MGDTSTNNSPYSVDKYITWADEAAELERTAPSTDKQHEGFIQEIPPHQHFNWWMHRTDRRLACLENPYHRDIIFSPPYSRGRTLDPEQGDRFEVPSYIVGMGTLRVELAGILCLKGEGENYQYQEIGEVGEMSKYIRFNDPIDDKYSILAENLNHVGVMVASTWNDEGGYYFVPVRIDQDGQTSEGYAFFPVTKDTDNDGIPDEEVAPVGEYTFDQNGEENQQSGGGASGNEEEERSGGSTEEEEQPQNSGSPTEEEAPSGGSTEEEGQSGGSTEEKQTEGSTSSSGGTGYEFVPDAESGDGGDPSSESSEGGTGYEFIPDSTQE